MCSAVLAQVLVRGSLYCGDKENFKMLQFTHVYLQGGNLSAELVISKQAKLSNLSLLACNFLTP